MPLLSKRQPDRRTSQITQETVRRLCEDFQEAPAAGPACQVPGPQAVWCYALPAAPLPACLPAQHGGFQGAYSTNSTAPTLEPLSREELLAAIRPTDAQFALCCLYVNRYYTQKRLQRASLKLGIPPLLVLDQFEMRRVHLRMATFVTPVKDLGHGRKVAAAAFTFRGTRLSRAGTVSADIQLMSDRNADLLIVQRALKHVRRHMRRLATLRPDVQWAFFATGHSLGGLPATAAAIQCPEVLEAVNFENPGLTTFYHKLAAQRGGPEYWSSRVTNYLAIPNPINMCQPQLGRIVRVHFPRLECRTDVTHVLRCLLGTGVRLVNWALAATAGVSAVCLLAGVSRSALACRLVEVWMSECALEMALPPVVSTAYWGLHAASAFVAAKLGTTLRHIMQQHSMWHMAQAFDPVTGVPERSVEMASWPRMERLTGTFGATLRRTLIECLYASPSSEGVSVMFHRMRMVEARVRALPGYVPLHDEDALSEAASLWLERIGDPFDVCMVWNDGLGASGGSIPPLTPAPSCQLYCGSEGPGTGSGGEEADSEGEGGRRRRCGSRAGPDAADSHDEEWGSSSGRPLWLGPVPLVGRFVADANTESEAELGGSQGQGRGQEPNVVPMGRSLPGAPPDWDSGATTSAVGEDSVAATGAEEGPGGLSAAGISDEETDLEAQHQSSGESRAPGALASASGAWRGLPWSPWLRLPARHAKLAKAL